MNNKLHSQAKLLLVDDSLSNLAVLSATLKNYQLITATDGLQALALANQQQPDLILLDIRMPNMDGYETCRQLKAKPETSDIPVIFVTGLDDYEDENKGFTLGAVDYITKPIRPILVKARVATQLQLKAQHDLLMALANTDDLTSLSNRRHFETLAEREWNRASRIEKPLHLLMIDIDHLKQYNDQYGHSAGEECLKNVAQVLKSYFRRATEISAHFGEGLFVGLMTDIDYQHANELAKQLINAISALAIPHGASPKAQHITVSIGLASTAINTYQSWQALLETADQNLHTSKNKNTGFTPPLIH